MDKSPTEITPAAATAICVVGGLVVAFGLVEFHKFRVAHEVHRYTAEGEPGSLASVGAAAPVEPSTTWFQASRDGTCFESDGPADRIEAIQGNGEQPQVSESLGPHGGQQVQVGEVVAGGLQVSFMTYYRLQSDCAASISQSNALADRYR